MTTISNSLRKAFPDYAIISVLAKGGQGTVLKAHLDGDTVALKIYTADYVEERSEREIAALRSIVHPNLVKLIDAGSRQIDSQECRYLTTEFIDGEPLSTLTARGPISVRMTARIVCDVARALDALWAARIVHRDIKPPNILVTSERAMLIDLGVARHLSLSNITTTGKTWGTEGYMSPEQMEAKRTLTVRSDVFALGIVAEECLVGQHPTRRRQAPLRNGGPRMESLLPTLPGDVVKCINLMVNEKPMFRPLPSAITNLLKRYAD